MRFDDNNVITLQGVTGPLGPPGPVGQPGPVVSMESIVKGHPLTLSGH